MDFRAGKRAIPAKDRIFVPIDVATLDEATALMDQLAGLISNVKIGLQLATRESWATVVSAAHERGFKIFCDSKFKDIPNTVEHAAYSMTYHKPEFFSVMADNNSEALQAMRRGADAGTKDFDLADSPKVIAVTVLTSINAEECVQIYGGNSKDKVFQFGSTAMQAGLDAIVCSPEEVEFFAQNEKFKDTLLITPGVRPAWAAANDQNRVATPFQAIKSGADMLVIGRPITQPPPEVWSVKEAVTRIINEIEEALSA